MRFFQQRQLLIVQISEVAIHFIKRLDHLKAGLENQPHSAVRKCFGGSLHLEFLRRGREPHFVSAETSPPGRNPPSIFCCSAKLSNSALTSSTFLEIALLVQ